MSFSSSFCLADSLPIKSNINEKSIHKIDSTSVSWKTKPRISYSDAELGCQKRYISVRVHVSSTGAIAKTKTIHSSGLINLDKKIENAIKLSKFKPFIENGIAIPFIAVQPFELPLNSESSSSKEDQCTYYIGSKVYNAQIQKIPTNFTYITRPKITLNQHELSKFNLNATFQFKLSLTNKVSNVIITQSSGVPSIDEKLKDSILNTKIKAPRKFYQLFKLTFEDEAYLNQKKLP